MAQVLSAVAEDFFRTARGSDPDIGAHEYVNATASLTASATGTPSSGQAPLTVAFTGSASGGTSPYSYRWTFGDGSSSTSQNPTHTYTSPGNYTATLTVTDSTSATASKSVSITATESSLSLSANASASPTSGQAPLTVNFTGSASGGTSPYTYNWTFGDGGTSSSQNPSHTYTSAGNYTATLTVTDSNSATATATANISVGTATSNASLSITAQTGAPAPGQGGTTDPAPGTYNYSIGSTVQSRSIAYTDYRFSKWEGDVSLSVMFNSVASIVLDKSKSLISTFCTKCADVNGDLKITPADAQAAFDIYLKKIASPTWCELENADVNSSGTKLEPKVTPADAQMIFNKYLKRGTAESTCSGNSRTATTSTLSSALPPVELTIGSSAVNENGDILIPIIVESPSPIGAFGFDLVFPSKRLTFVGFERTDLTSDYVQLDANVFPYPAFPDDGKSAQATVLPPDSFDARDNLPASSSDSRVLRVGGYKTEGGRQSSSGVLITLIFRVSGQSEDSSPISIIATYDDIQNASVTNAEIKPFVNEVERLPRENRFPRKEDPRKK